MTLRDITFGATDHHRFQHHRPDGSGEARVVTDDDLAPRPEPAQGYLRFRRVCGAQHVRPRGDLMALAPTLPSRAHGAPRTNTHDLDPLRLPVRLSTALAVVAAMAASATFFVDDVLRGEAVMDGSARGTALVMLVVALPALLAGMWATTRGSARGVLVWGGSLLYLVYNAVLLIFATPFNRLFLLYEATLGLAVAAAVSLWHRVDHDVIAGRLRSAPARSIAVYLWVIVTFNAFAWLRNVVPALGDAAPAFLTGTGLTTNPIYAQDLAIWLPLVAITAWWLWQRTARGYVAAGAVLVFWLIEAVGVATDQWFGAHADPGSTVATMSGCWLFVALAMAGAAALAAYLRLPTSDR